jgi:hypothetical protein
MNLSELKYSTISDLNKFHDYTNRMFLEHQKSIMNSDYQKAYHQLSHLVKLIRQHLKDEEEFLVPPYQKLVKPLPAGGAVGFYLREHRQISIIVDKFITDFKKWLTSPPAKNEVVRMFDSYFKFKELLDHHDARERVFLYRLLDQKLDKSEKQIILDKIKNNMDKISVES